MSIFETALGYEPGDQLWCSVEVKEDKKKSSDLIFSKFIFTREPKALCRMICEWYVAKWWCAWSRQVPHEDQHQPLHPQPRPGRHPHVLVWVPPVCRKHHVEFCMCVSHFWGDCPTRLIWGPLWAVWSRISDGLLNFPSFFVVIFVAVHSRKTVWQC